MATNTNTDWKSALTNLEDTLDLYLNKKAPSLPDKWKEVIVSIGPWITLVLLLISLPALFALLAVGTVLSTLAGYHVFSYIAFNVLTVVSLVLEAIALPHLFKRSKKGWDFLFYATLVSAVSNLLALNIGGLVIGTLISLYVLFQIRSYYK